MHLSDPVLLIAIPLTASLVALVGKTLRWELGSSVLAFAVFLLSIAPLLFQAPQIFAGEVLVADLGGWGAPVGIGLRMDAFAWIASALIVSIGSIVLLVSFSGPSYRSSYFFFATMLLAGMQMVTLTNDIFTMFVGFEVIAIAAYLLIGFDQTDAGLLASLKYLFLSSVGVLFFLIGVFFVYRDVGSLSITRIAEVIRASGLRDSRSIHLAVATMCVGIGVRTAFIPFHTWLPEAHAYAPHPVSALLSGVLIKVSLFAMIRILIAFDATYLNELLLWIGAITAIVSVGVALSQSDLKRLLAYHSISQMGYILAAFGAASAASYTGLYAHAIGHALFKSLLFLAAGEIIHATGTRNVYEMKGIGSSRPFLAVMVLVGALSIAAIPPFVGFASKQLATTAVGSHLAYYLLWATSVGTVASFVKVGRIAMPRRREFGESIQPTGQRPGTTSVIGMLVLGVACLAAGLFATDLAEGLASLTGFGAAAQGAAPVDFTPPPLFKASKLVDTIPIVALGIVLYLAAMSRFGHRITDYIAAVRPQLGTVLLFFVAGLSIFAVFAYI